MKNYYQILNVPEDATKTEIKKSYFELAKKYHPDKLAQEGNADNSIFADIAEAYEILSDEEKRKEYDEKLKKYKEGIDIEEKKREEKFENYYLKAKRNTRQKKFDQAIEYFKKLEMHFKYKNKKPSPEFKSYYGYALFFSNRDKKSGLQLMDDAVTSSNFSDEEIMLNLIEAYFEIGKTDRANELFKHVVEINPKNKRAYMIKQKYKPKKKSLLDIILRRK